MIALVVAIGMSGGQEPAKHQLPGGWNTLGLSKAQVDAVYRTQAEYKAKIIEAQNRLVREERDALLNLLTDQQKAKLYALAASDEAAKQKK
jgi:hypothetical protein